LAKANHLYLAYLSVQEQNKGRAASSAREHWVQNQALSVLKKLVDPEVDRWSLTKDKWFATERRCERLNRKFEALINRRNRGLKPTPFGSELYRFYEALVFAMGENPPLDEIAEEAYYGPGSTVSVRGREVHFVRKVAVNDCVPLAIDLAVESLLHDKAAWVHVGMDPIYSHLPSAQDGFRRVMRQRLADNTVRCDRLMFIHKGIESLRSIGAQPTVSGSLQLGVHTVLARALTKVGVNLQDQSWNQRFAYLGSKNWRDENPICTLDKSDASNLQCKNLVVYLYPPAWSKLLMRVRTPSYVSPPEFGGGVFDYYMYAGMGNGTTFAVETLTFWAAAYATSECQSVDEFVRLREFAIYGDDVALKRDHAIRYMRFARFLGFRFNTKKTFTDGPFRESCGADYYDGVPVRPATLDVEGLKVTDLDLIGFHNTLADSAFPLKGACRKIRSIYARNIFPIVPTDPTGNLGFRPIDTPHYTLVKDRGGKVQVSTAWHRPRTYILEVRPQFADLGELDSWTQIAVSLLRGRQATDPSTWSLPTRESSVSTRVIPERDMERKDLVQMITNQLSRLAVNKTTPWWSSYRGIVEGG
jgi:hypothetical protein